MRMRLGTRIVFSLFLLVVMGICVLVVLAVFGAITAENVIGLTNGFLETGYKFIWAAAALVLFICALCLLFFGSNSKEPTLKSVVLATSTDGTIEISTDALRELADTYLKDISGIFVQKIVVHAKEYRSLRITVYLSVRKEVEIPMITAQISQGIREYIETFSGIEASEVMIRVMPNKQGVGASK